jgi:hypothetical protein
MKKSLIALAIVAALPVAAQADATISGSVTTKYKNTGVINTDAALTIASSEVLANGMTATASIDVLGEGSQGIATLAGDFGTLTAGKIDSDGAFQAGDVASVVGDTEDADSDGTTVYGLHYSGDMAGLAVAAQLNANTAADSSTGATKGTQMSATYDFNGLTVGYAYASADADNGVTTGVNEGQSAFGVSYSFGDLVVTAGKQSLKAAASTSPDTLISATYTYTFTADALTVKAQMDNYYSATDSSDHQIDITFALNDAISVAAEVDKGKDTSLTATYTAGDLTAIVSRTDDGTTDASVALDYGNADLTVGRVGKTSDTGAYTHVTYKVAF